MNHERVAQLKKAKISPSEELVERLQRWGWINASLNQVPFREINMRERKRAGVEFGAAGNNYGEYYELIEVESIDDADVMMIHGRVYPIKESDIEKLKKAQRREAARNR